ncbi:hypothetical protein NN561_015965 [Cricetulus griseus]
MGLRALSPLASLPLRWLLACGLLGPVLDAGRPGGCWGDGIPGAPRPGLGAPLVSGGASCEVDPRLPAPLTALTRSPAAGCTLAVSWPLPGCGQRSRVEWLSLVLGWELELLLQSIRI